MKCLYKKSTDKSKDLIPSFKKASRMAMLSMLLLAFGEPVFAYPSSTKINLSNTDGNIDIKTKDDKTTVNLADKIKVDSVTLEGKSKHSPVTTLSNTGLTISDGPSVTVDGIDAGDEVVGSVAAGEVSSTSTDAINGGQLYGTASSVATALGGGSVVNDDGTISAPSYNVQGASYNNVGSAIGALDANVSRLDNRIDRVGAMSAALSSIQPGVYNEACPSSFGVGVGAYNGKYALGFGLNHYTSKYVMFNIGAAISEGDGMGRAGVVIAFGSHPKKVAKVESSAELDELRAMVNTQKSEIQALVKRISVLENRKRSK